MMQSEEVLDRISYIFKQWSVEFIRNVKIDYTGKIAATPDIPTFKINFILPTYSLYLQYIESDSSFEYCSAEDTVRTWCNTYGLNLICIRNIEQVNILCQFLKDYSYEINQEVINNILQGMNTIKVPLSHDKAFHTLQCEGKYAGLPSIFIRLSYCNLKCSWCDSYYTWKPEYVNDKERPTLTTLMDLFHKVKSVDMTEFSSKCGNIVITGGEPLLFQDKLSLFVYYLLIHGYSHIEIETNGTIVPNDFLSTFCYFNVSPKLSNNNADLLNKRRVDAAINKFNQIKNSIFKFVISSEKDWSEINRDYIDYFYLHKNKVYLMPEGQTPEELSKKRQFVTDLCIRNNINFSDRLQVVVWGAKRGV